jgi:hypothetical protein
LASEGCYHLGRNRLADETLWRIEGIAHLVRAEARHPRWVVVLEATNDAGQERLELPRIDRVVAWVWLRRLGRTGFLSYFPKI